MKKSVILSFILMIMAAVSTSATKRIDINIETIKTSVQSSPDEYRKLLNRFIVADSTLTLDQLATVYYGAPFFADINVGRYDAKIDEAYSKRDFNLMYLLSDNALRENPVSLNLLAMTFISANNCDEAQAKYNLENLQSRMAMLTDLITASGDGISVESPILITSENDRLVFLMLDSTIEEIIDQSPISDCVAIKVKHNGSSNPAIIYFKGIN